MKSIRKSPPSTSADIASLETGNWKLETPTHSVGVFGGTFAPMHNGHLRLAIESRERLHLSCVHIVPSARPPHRAAPEVAAERRLEWARLAVGDEAGLYVDDRELRRAAVGNDPSYTYDTLAEIRAEHADAPLFLLLGADAANQLHSWRRWRELFDLAHVIFIERAQEPGATSSELSAFLRGRQAASIDAMHGRLAGQWLPLSLPPLAISSTRIRQLLQAGRSLRGLVPDAVIHSFTPEDVRALTKEVDSAHDIESDPESN